MYEGVIKIMKKIVGVLLLEIDLILETNILVCLSQVNEMDMAFIQK